MYLGRPEHWRITIYRFLHGKKVCRNCWRFPFACKHMDPEIAEEFSRALREGRINRITLPERD